MHAKIYLSKEKKTISMNYSAKINEIIFTTLNLNGTPLISLQQNKVRLFQKKNRKDQTYAL